MIVEFKSRCVLLSISVHKTHMEIGVQIFRKLPSDTSHHVNTFYLPAPSLSLKAAAPAFGFRWRQDDCGAMDSMVYFTNWLKTGNKEQLDKVLMYNEDDCKAMLFVENYLNDKEALSL